MIRAPQLSCECHESCGALVSESARGTAAFQNRHVRCVNACCCVFAIRQRLAAADIPVDVCGCGCRFASAESGVCINARIVLKRFFGFR